MIYADWVLLGLIAISTLIGLLRGFIREVLALAVWVAAFLAAFQYAGAVAGWIGESISVPSARTAAAFGAVFLVVVVIGALLTWLVGKLVEKTGLSGTDRLLGGVFGALRGVLLIVVLIVLAGFTPVPQDPWWRESRVIASLLPLADWAADFLPESIREHFDLYQGVLDKADFRVSSPGAMVESPAAFA